MVSVLAQRLASVTERQHELELRQADRQKERQVYLQTTARASDIEAAYSQWKEAVAELSRWDEIAEQFREHEKQRQEPRTQIEAERARLSQEIENLQAQASSVEQEEARLPDLRSRISTLQSLISNLVVKSPPMRCLKPTRSVGWSVDMSNLYQQPPTNLSPTIPLFQQFSQL